ncbi:MAG: CHAT domain-containing protein [candidate division Zixibacteria bacterium]|nr:CHAT domain-containing protein [candidate division Zixibacteria bacterium]
MKTRMYGVAGVTLFLLLWLTVGQSESSPIVPRKTAIETLVQQAASYRDAHQDDSALICARRAYDLAAGETDLPGILKAKVYDCLGRGLFAQAQYDSAGILLTQALADAERAGGDSLIADILIPLAGVYHRRQEWTQGDSCLWRALAIQENAYGRDHPALIPTLTALTDGYYKQYHYMDAEPVCQRLLALITANEGPASPGLIKVLRRLGWVSSCQIQFEATQVYCRRAISVAEQQSPPDYPGLAELYAELCQAYFNAGDFDAAEETGPRALAIAEEHVGRNDRVTAEVLMRLGGMYCMLQKNDLAESCIRRALTIRRMLQPGDNADVAQSLFALGYVYRHQDRYPETIAYYKMTCDMLRRLFGPEDPTFLRRQLTLAEAYAVSGQSLEAQRIYEANIPIMKKVIGPAGNITVWAVNQLAELYAVQGRNAEAETILLEILTAMEQAYGPRYFYNGYVLESLMELYRRMEIPDKARQYGERLLRLRQDLAEKIFALSSERQKLSWLDSDPVVIPSLLSLAVSYPGRRADTVALNMILYGKAIVFDAVMDEKAATFCNTDAAVREGIRERADLCTAIANLAVGSGGGAGSDSLREELTRLYNALETVETDLSRHCSDFGAAMVERKVSFTQVGNRLPSGAILLEYVKTEPSDPIDNMPGYPASNLSQYMVFTLDRAGRITLTDLGEAGRVDSLITEARRMIYDAENRIYSPMAPYLEDRLKEVTAVLYQCLVAPIEKNLAGATQVLISPDGALNLLPFDILPKPDGSYLIEQYRISYLSSGRDLLRFDRHPVSGQGAVIIGDPDYNLVLDTMPSDSEADRSIFAAVNAWAVPPRAADTASSPGRQFLPLQFSREESMIIAQTIGRTGRIPVREYYGAEAGEEVLKQMTSPPRILHFSTHGYFIPAAWGYARRGYANPLLRSGLAMAGANRRPAAISPEGARSEDGILTAFEVSRMNLNGTELAALSACETGVGEPSAGEGVFGLRRAFLHAGVQSVLMSLWNVPDRETAELMDGFYERWLGGMSKAEALRASALDLLQKARAEKGHGHPLLWGGFVLAGNPW